VGDERRQTLGEDEVRSLIVRAMGADFPFEILSISPWVRRELVADSYGRGRVHLVGDACHLNSPTGAFGMNTGMQDAVNLAWKLAAVHDGWGGPRLLASYGEERRPVALRNVEEASENLRRMLSTRKDLSADVFRPGPEGDKARKIFGDAYTQMMKREWFTLHIHLGYRYAGSPVIVSDGAQAPDDPPMTYTQNAVPGSRAPHVWLKPGVSTLDLFGRGFVLVRFDAAIDAGAFAQAAAACGAPFEIVDLDHAPARALYAAPLVLVRPDGMVAWRGTHARDAQSIFDAVRGG
jgi:FAD binding domain